MHADYRDYLDGLMAEIQPREPRDVARVWRTLFDEERALAGGP